MKNNQTTTKTNKQTNKNQSFIFIIYFQSDDSFFFLLLFLKSPTTATAANPPPHNPPPPPTPPQPFSQSDADDSVNSENLQCAQPLLTLSTFLSTAPVLPQSQCIQRVTGEMRVLVVGGGGEVGGEVEGGVRGCQMPTAGPGSIVTRSTFVG